MPIDAASDVGGSTTGEATKGPVRGIELPDGITRLRGRLPGPVRHGAAAAVRRYGSATARQRPLPDFLIIGAKKAGTSSLMNWLLRHPAVFSMFPRIQATKSPHFFDLNFWRGPAWYASHFPTRRVRRRRERQIGTLSVVGEASPYYMFHPAAPARAAATVPDARVIVLLRDPVSRAYSNFWDRKAFGSEDLATFEQALAAEQTRLATVDDDRLRDDPRYYSFHHDHHSYLARGRYAEHLEPWLGAVAPERRLVLQAEHLFVDPAGAFGTVQRFLGIPETAEVPLRHYNERQRPAMDPATRGWLADYYRPHNQTLYRLLGQDLGWERGYPPAD